MTVFFGAPHPGDGRIRLGGTGFLVVHKEDGVGFGYLVTAKHVAQKVRPNGNAVIRVNENHAGARELQVDDIYWAFHSDTAVDVAVTPCNISPTQFDVAYYNLTDLVRPSSSPFRVQCGDPICIVGLFHWHSGSGRNTPIVHSGNIALLPDPNEKVPIGTQHVEAYLVEAQTFEGLSGAPVFQREIVAVKAMGEHNGGLPIMMTGAQLLGVYCGAWEGNPSAALAEERHWGPDKRIPAGMGVVAPAERIEEIILTNPELNGRRKAILAERQKSNSAVEDSILPDLPAGDTNPTHREDFDHLLGKAAKTNTGQS
jgi:hypothetical protein